MLFGFLTSGCVCGWYALVMFCVLDCCRLFSWIIVLWVIFVLGFM